MKNALPGAQQPEVDPLEVELVAEEDLADGRPDGDTADDPEHAHADHDEHQLAQAAAEVVDAAGAREARELRQQRGLHRLEQEDRDAGDEEADDEVGDHRPLHRALGEHDPAERGGVAQGLSGERPEQQVREVGGELRPFGVGAGRHEPVLAAQRDQHRDHRRHREREAVPEQVVDAERHERDQRDHADDALGPEDHAVGAEAPVARERALDEELHRVGREPDQEAQEQHRLAVEQPVDEREDQCPHEGEDDQPAGERRARPRGLADHRPAAFAVGAAVGDGAADLLLEREEEPGATTNSRIQSPFSAA